jgi:hypothetical protein
MCSYGTVLKLACHSLSTRIRDGGIAKPISMGWQFWLIVMAGLASFSQIG